MDIVKFASSAFDNTKLLKSSEIHESLLRKYLKDNKWSDPSIEAYDYWLDVLLPKYLKEKFVFSDKSYIYFDNIQLSDYQKPPKYYREQKTSYNIKLEADIYYFKNTLLKAEKVHICDLPLMVGSKRCPVGKAKKEHDPDSAIYALGEDPLDPFGYFINNGTERVVINQEKMRYNKFDCIIESVTDGKKAKDITTKKVPVIEGTITYDTHYGTKILKITRDPNGDGQIMLYLTIFGDRKLNIPVLLLFKHPMMGNMPLDDIMESILKYSNPKYRDLIKVILSRPRLDYVKNADLYTYIFKLSAIKDFEQLKSDFDEYMKTRFFPLAIGKSSIAEIYSYMICKFCIAILDPDTVDDRNVWAHKQVDWPAKSFENLFVSMFNNIYNSINSDISRQNTITMHSIQSSINKEDISSTFRKSLAGPKWGKSNRAPDRMTEVLESKSILNMMSQLTKINVRTNPNTKNIAIRMVQGDQLGFICPVEITEGEMCGIIKHLACTCKISLSRDPSVIYEQIKKYLTPTMTKENTSPFFINGYIYGWCDGLFLRNKLVSLKRSNLIWYDCSIVLENYGYLKYHTDYSFCPLNVYCDSGRPIRPLLVYDYPDNNVLEGKVHDNILNMSFTELLNNGAVEFIDPWENNYVKIAQNFTQITDTKRIFKEQIEYIKTLESMPDSPDKIFKLDQANKQYKHIMDSLRFTHVEMDPNALLSYTVNVVPMGERIYGPRLVYQAGMNRQSLETEKGLGRDAKYTSLAGTSPNFITNMNKILRIDSVAGGRNIYLAVMTYLGYNQEDAIIMNKDVVDRLYFSFYRNVKKIIEINVDKDEDEKVGIPKAFEGLSKNPYYRHLVKTEYKDGIPVYGGFVKIGSYIKENDILVAKFNKSGKNTSVRASIDDIGRVVDVSLKDIIGKTSTVCVITIKKFYNPQVGDKMTIRYSQKGIIGKILPSSQMPLMENGKPIDMIINPHAIPSRMTVSLLIEMLTGNYAPLVGSATNATTFSEFNVEHFIKEMFLHGIDLVSQNLINPFTGRYFEQKINVGRVYYQSLPHMVESKIQSRSTGPVDPKTRLVLGGRNRGGGIRAGEMEIDSFMSHGALNVTLDRIMISSDRYDKAVCKKCSQEAWFNKDSGNYECKLKCGAENVGRITIPYSFNRFMEIIRMGSIHGLINYVERSKVEEVNKNIKSYALKVEEDIDVIEMEDAEESDIDDNDNDDEL